MNQKFLIMLAITGFSLSAYAEPGMDGHGPGGPKDHPLTDAQIVSIVKTTNDGEIAAAREEKNHGQSEDAKAFAKMMIDQHTQNNKDFKDLEKKLQMHGEKTAMSDKIHRDGEATVARLDKMKGADLDRAYVDKQVEMHQHVLDKLDTVLIPQAKNDDLKMLLQNTRATVAQHLAHAQDVQRTVDGGTAATTTHQ